MIPNVNTLWGRVLADELVRAGVRHACVAPGSRSTPIVLGLHAHSKIRLTTHLDERGAAYFALGIAQATRRPVALACTSGTAAANFLPALVEASEARHPLIVLTADRPPELHGVGANQTIDQQRLYGGFARAFHDAGLPQANPARVRDLRTTISRAVAAALAPPQGPAHLNLPFQEPLEPTVVDGGLPDAWASHDPDAQDGRPGGEPFLPVHGPALEPDEGALAVLSGDVARERRGLLILGPRAPDDQLAAAALDLARAAHYPILADPASGARFGGQPDALRIESYDALLSHAPTAERLRPRLVLRVGRSPTSKTLLRLLNSGRDTRHIILDEAARGAEPTQGPQSLLHCDPVHALRHLAAEVRGRPDAHNPWTQAWSQAEATAARVLRAETPQRAFEGALLQRVFDQLPDDATIFVSNSLPIRDVDRFARAPGKRIRLFANRGASGIDGIVSTALGVAHGLQRRVVLITGDLALLHDLNGLAAARRLGLSLDVLVLDNDGGGIFEFLPIAAYGPPFEELFVTPHGTDLEPLARAFGFHYEAPALDAAIRTGIPDLGRPGSNRFVHVRTERQANVRERRAIEARLAAELEPLAEART